MLKSRANRRIQGDVAPAVFFPSRHRFGNCFKSEDTTVMDPAGCFITAEDNRSAVLRTRSKETAPDATLQNLIFHLRAIEDDQP